jgi:hypothetical protein
MPGERANIIAEVDNSKCQVDVVSIDTVMRCHLRLKSDHHHTKHISEPV